MSLFAIGDTHLSLGTDKPMNIFRGWDNYVERLVSNWNRVVDPGDTVVIMGDVSWGMSLSEAYKDFELLNSLPGKKIIMKGNHDYWWSSLNKMNNLDFKSIHFLHNNSFEYKDYSICGTRGWASRDSFEFSEDDEKIYLREVQRLKNSLDTCVNKKIIAMIHYPPFNQDLGVNEFSQTLADYKVEKCVYGHLHGKGHKYSFEGDLMGVDYHFVASDFLNFKLKKLEED